MSMPHVPVLGRRLDIGSAENDALLAMRDLLEQQGLDMARFRGMPQPVERPRVPRCTTYLI